MTDWQFEYNRLVNSAMKLNRMYKRKTKILERAIEYIDKTLLPYGNENCWDDLFIQNKVVELKEILKGVQDETTTIK